MNGAAAVDPAARIAQLRELTDSARRDEADLRQRLAANPEETRDLLATRVAEREAELDEMRERREVLERRLSECGLQYKSELADKQRFMRTLQVNATQLRDRVAAKIGTFDDDGGGGTAASAIAFAVDAARAREDDIAVQQKTLRELQAAVASTRALLSASESAQTATRRAVTAQRDAKIAAMVESMMHDRHTILLEIANVQRINAQYASVLRHHDAAAPPPPAQTVRGRAAVVPSHGTVAVTHPRGQVSWISQKHQQMRVEADTLFDAVASMQAEKAALQASIKESERMQRAKRQEWSSTLQRLQKDTVSAKAHTTRLIQSNTRMTHDVQKLRESLDTLTKQRQQLVGDVLLEDF